MQQHHTDPFQEIHAQHTLPWGHIIVISYRSVPHSGFVFFHVNIFPTSCPH